MKMKIKKNLATSQGNWYTCIENILKILNIEKKKKERKRKKLGLVASMMFEFQTPSDGSITYTVKNYGLVIGIRILSWIILWAVIFYLCGELTSLEKKYI